jgi:hypothetical protein
MPLLSGGNGCLRVGFSENAKLCLWQSNVAHAARRQFERAGLRNAVIVHRNHLLQDVLLLTDRRGTEGKVVAKSACSVRVPGNSNGNLVIRKGERENVFFCNN